MTAEWPQDCLGDTPRRDLGGARPGIYTHRMESEFSWLVLVLAFAAITGGCVLLLARLRRIATAGGVATPRPASRGETPDISGLEPPVHGRLADGPPR